MVRVLMLTRHLKKEHPFRIAVVCATWLTGFDVPSLANLYLDKPLKSAYIDAGYRAGKQGKWR